MALVSIKHSLTEFKLTEALRRKATRVDPKCSSKARYVESVAIPLGVAWVAKFSGGHRVWVGKRPTEFTAGQLVSAIYSKTEPKAVVMADHEIAELQQVILSAVERAFERGKDCPFCDYATHLDTCVVVKIRRGEWVCR